MTTKVRYERRMYKKLFDNRTVTLLDITTKVRINKLLHDI